MELNGFQSIQCHFINFICGTNAVSLIWKNGVEVLKAYIKKISWHFIENIEKI
jgi:hypothetical protein